MPYHHSHTSHGVGAMIRKLRTWLAGTAVNTPTSSSRQSRRFRPNLETLEQILAPANWAIHLNGPSEGMMGSTAASHTGALMPNSSLPTNANGDTLVQAATQQDAIALGLVGSITAQVGGQSYTYSIAPNAVGASTMEHRPFLYGGGMLALEDMAGAPSGCDWDYNDRYWYVSVTEVSVAPPTVSIAAGADAAEGGADGTFTFTRTGDLTAALTAY